MKHRTTGWRAAQAGVLGIVMLLAGAGVGQAELQKVEAVGISGIHEAQRSRVVPRDEAVARARWEGVSRVALELIGESTPNDLADGADADSQPDGSGAGAGSAGRSTDSNATPEDQDAALKKALGKDLLPYMRSYRIIEDRGETPVLFDEDPDVKVEYVVVVEVIVDVDRVTRALENAGLIARTDVDKPAGAPVLVELVGLSRYEAFDLVMKTLRERLGATRVQAVEFAPERQVLSVQVPFGPEALSARLASFESDRLLLEPIGVDVAGRRIRMLGRWFPPDATPTDAPGDTRRPSAG
jgi:hypothetical protein